MVGGMGVLSWWLWLGWVVRLEGIGGCGTRWWSVMGVGVGDDDDKDVVDCFFT